MTTFPKARIPARGVYGGSLPPAPERGGVSAFSLTELLVVLVAITILASMAYPSYARSRMRARTVKCVSHLRSLGQATHVYVQDHAGHLPTSRRLGTRTVMWTETLWPYVYPGMKYSGYSGPELPKSLKGTIFECPEAAYDRNRKPHLTNVRSYGMNHNMGDLNDATSELLISLENPSQICLLADCMNESQLRPYTLNPRHEDRYNALMLDGHVESKQLGNEVTLLTKHPFWGVSVESKANR